MIRLGLLSAPRLCARNAVAAHMDSFRQRKSGRRVSGKAAAGQTAASVPSLGLGHGAAAVQIGPGIALQADTAPQADEALEAALTLPAQPLDAAAGAATVSRYAGCFTIGSAQKSAADPHEVQSSNIVFLTL